MLNLFDIHVGDWMLHDRMPVILPVSAYDRWLDADEPVSDLQSLLKPYPRNGGVSDQHLRKQPAQSRAEVHRAAVERAAPGLKATHWCCRFEPHHPPSTMGRTCRLCGSTVAGPRCRTWPLNLRTQPSPRVHRGNGISCLPDGLRTVGRTILQHAPLARQVGIPPPTVDGPSR